MNRVFFALFGIAFVIYITIKVKKNRFSESRSLFWVIGGIAIFFLSVFPKTIDKLSALLGIYYPPSLLFLLALFFILYSLFRLEEELTATRERMKNLAHRYSILENQVRTGKNSPPEEKEKGE